MANFKVIQQYLFLVEQSGEPDDGSYGVINFFNIKIITAFIVLI